jgi:outer membrane protein
MISMNLKSFSLLLLFSLSLCAGSFGQADSAGVRVWNLRQCVEYALNSNLVIHRSAYGVKTSKVDFDQSRWFRVPTLSGSLNYRFNWGRNVDPTTNDYTTEELRNLSPSIDASMMVFNGFRIHNSIRENGRAFYAAEHDLQKTKNDVMVNVTSLYITVIFNKEQLENARYQLASSQSQLDRVRKQVAAGALAKSEELNLDAQVATNEVNLVQRENALNLSILQLKQGLQIPATQSLDVEMIDIAVEDLVLDQSRDEVFDIARQIMPEIKSANLRVESSVFAMRSARGNLFPRLSLFASTGSNYSSRFDINGYGYQDQLNDNIQRALGFTLSIPLLNNYQNRANVQRSIINHEVAIISAKEAENTLRQSVENAYNDAIASQKTYNASLRQVAAREEAFRMVTQRREAGAATAFEYQIAENDLFGAKSDLTRAKYDFIFRKKILDFYQGKPLQY